ncbi:L,D-transpeptidase, partial [Escherichia coli]
MNWKRTRSLNGKSGAFLRPHLQHLQILCTSLHYPTLSPSIIQAYLFITITLY